MNPKYMQSSGRPSNARMPGDLQDLCSFAIDQAIEIEKLSCLMFAGLNSCTLEIYKNTLPLQPVCGCLLDLVSQAMAFSMELQWNGLTMLIPFAFSNLNTPESYGNETQPTGNELAESMDIAIGATFTAPFCAVQSISSIRAQPEQQVPEREQVLERDMDLAMGALA